MTLKKRTNHMTVLGKVAIILNIVYIFIPSALFVSLTLYTSVCLCINLLFWVQSKKKGQYYIYKRDILLIGYLCCILISCFVSVDLDASLSYCIMLASALFLYFALRGHQDWFKIFEVTVAIFGSINAAITVYSSLDFASFQAMFSGLISASAMDFAVRVSSNTGAFSGIMGQTGTNAFCISIAVMVICSRFRHYNKILLTALLTLDIFALLLTAKRGALLWMGCALIVAYFLRQKRASGNISSKLIRIVLAIIALSIIVVVIVQNVPAAQFVFDRFAANDGDLSSGRFDLYVESLTVIRTHFFGVGINAYSSYMGENVHNDYLQTMAEIGIIGALLIFGFLLRETISAISDYTKRKSSPYSLLYIAMSIFLWLYGLTAFPMHNFGMCIQLFMVYAAIRAFREGRKKVEVVHLDI